MQTSCRILELTSTVLPPIPSPLHSKLRLQSGGVSRIFAAPKSCGNGIEHDRSRMANDCKIGQWHFAIVTSHPVWV